MVQNYKFFKHPNNDSMLSIQSEFTRNLILGLKPGESYFEIQIEINQIMTSKIVKDKIENWLEISNDEFKMLLVNISN